MTEAEWLACTDPKKMLEFIGAKASERHIRLFAVACCRAIWGLMNESLRRVVEVGERYAEDADGFVIEAEQAAWLALEQGGESNPVTMAAWCTVCLCMEPECFYIVALDTLVEVNQVLDDWSPQRILLCIFGNPFRPVTIEASWLTPKVKCLAQAIYDERTFDCLPILADALKEGGCTNEEILAHLRGPGPHVRGCSVVDLLLGKD